MAAFPYWPMILLAFPVYRKLMPTLPTPIPFYANCIIGYIFLLFSLIYGILIALILRPFGMSGICIWSAGRLNAWLLTSITGLQVCVVEGKGRLQLKNVAFVVNHQTEFDVFILGALVPKNCTLTVKSTLRKVPFLGWFLSIMNTVFIDRGKSAKGQSAFREASRSLRENGQSVWVFPEGTRSSFTTPDLLDFKKGAFHLAVQAQIPIVPIVIRNYSDTVNKKARRFLPGRISAKVLEPITTKGLTEGDVDGLTLETRELMLGELVQLSRQVQSLD